MDVLDELIAAFRRLPTIGPKTARRLALHVLQRDRDAAAALSSGLYAALDSLQPCARCRQLTPDTLCDICSDSERDQQLVCVVESLDDLYSIEQTGVFEGRYFLLNGHLSPLDGIGPEELGLPQLAQQVNDPGIREIVLALNPQVEGEATAQYIVDQLGDRVAITTLAQGVPLGRDLARLDASTLSVAMTGRVTRKANEA